MKKGTLLFPIICLVSVCVFFFLAIYQEAEKAAIRQLNDEQQLHAKQAAQGIEYFFAMWTEILNSFSKTESIINVDADGKRYMALFYETHNEQIKSITRVDENGRILYTVPYSSVIGSNISEQKHVKEILRGHKSVVSDVFRTVQGFDAIAYHVPVFKGSEFKGTVAIVIDFKNLAKRYLEAIKIGKTGYAWIIGQDGTVLYSPVSGFTGKFVFDIYKDFPTIIFMSKNMMQGYQGTTIYFDKIRGSVRPVKKYAVYMPIKIINSFWSIVVASSEDEVLFSLSSFRRKLILVTVIILFVGILFSTISVKAWLIVMEDKKHKQVENDLRNSEQKFMKAFHATPDAIVISRVTDGLFLEVNEVFLRITGYSRDEALKKTTIDLDLWVDPSDRERYITGLKKQGKIRDMEAQFRTKTGLILDGLVSGGSITLGDDLCILTIIRDITEQKKTRIELEKYHLHLEELIKERTIELEIAKDRAESADKLKSIFLATMSHELRTPLNSIIGFTGIILQGFAGTLNDEQRKQLNMVKLSADHLLLLINDVLDISKIEAGQLNLDSAPFEMQKAIESVVQMVLPLAEKKALPLHVNVSPDAGIITGDKRRVQQILFNLFSNAIKFTEKGEVKIECYAREDKIVTRVIDTGIGIKPDQISNLFKPFMQIENGISRRYEGTGLGLSICKKLVGMMEGSIGVESEWGKGSVFTFTLPIQHFVGKES